MQKNYKSSALKLIMMLSLSSASIFQLSAQQMSGTVFINQNGTASTTVFRNWFSFWRSLQGLSRTDGGPTMTAGLGGNLTVEVQTSNTTAETSAVEFPASIGSFQNRRITINGNGNTLLYSGTSAAIRFTGANCITLNRLTIQNTSTAPGGIWFSNQSDSITVNQCNIFLSNLVSVNTTTYYISMSNSLTSPAITSSVATGTSGQPGSFNTISACRFYTQAGSPGPYYGVTMMGNTANYLSTAQNNSLLNCTFENFNYGAVWMAYTNGNMVIGNDIARPNATAGGQTILYGIYSNYAASTLRSNEVSKNNIHDLPFNGATTSTTNISTIYGTYMNYIYGTNTNKFIMDGNIVRRVYYLTGSRYVHWVNYCEYVDVMNNIIDDVDGTSTSTAQYDWYINYPTAVRCNYNVCTNSNTNGYLYSFFINYSTDGLYTWQEFIGNRITNNTAGTFMYATYIYWYRGNTDWKVNNNYVVNNRATSNTGRFYFYLYYYMNYEVIGNVVAGNRGNYQYIYLYSALSGAYTAEVRNNTFEADMSTAPVPTSAYLYPYFYLYNHTCWFTGNIFDFRGGPNVYYRYFYIMLSFNNPANLREFDHNTYYVENNFTINNWNINGNMVSNWAGFSGGGYPGPNDNNVEPKYRNKAAFDFRPTAWATQNNVPYNPLNPADVNGVSRNRIRHDRGGLENPTDLEIVETNFSVGDTVCSGFTGGPSSITIRSNYNWDEATGFNVSYAVNGGPKTSARVNKKLNFGDTARIWFPKPVMLNEYGENKIAVFVDLPDDNNSNDSLRFRSFVKPAPGGGKFAFSGKHTVAVYQYTKSNDITMRGAPVIYNSVAPRVYDNTGYGINWVASAYAVTQGGRLRPSMEVTFTPPAGTQDLEVQYLTNDASIEDTLVWVCLKVTDLNNGCDTTIRRQVLIYPKVNVAFTFPASICDGDAVQFENKSTIRSGSKEFLWDFGTGKAADRTESPEPVFTFPASGTYKVKLMAKTLPYGFPSEDSIIVTVKPKPTARFTHTNACAGANLTFNSSGTTSGSSLSWRFGDNTFATAPNPVKRYNSPGNYTVTLTATQGGCSDVATKRVYQFAAPKAAFVQLNGICDNDAFSFRNNSNISIGTYGSFWNFDDGNRSTDMNPSHLFASAGDKKVKLVVVSEFGCRDSVTTNVVVRESPKVNFSFDRACSLSPTVFTNTTPVVGTPGGAVKSYSWKFDDGSSQSGENAVKTWNTVGPKTITYNIELTNGCRSSVTKNITVGVEPDALFSTADQCEGKPVVFQNLTKWNEGEISFLWNFGDGTTSTEANPSHVYASAFTPNVTLYASVAGGCSDSVVIPVNVFKAPSTCDFVANPDYAFSFHGVRMQAINSSGLPVSEPGVTYTWVIKGQGNRSGADIQHNLRKDGVYQVTFNAKVDATGCQCSKTKEVVMQRSNISKTELGDLMVFPNPNDGNFQLVLPEYFGTGARLELYNPAGSLVKTIDNLQSGNQMVQTGMISDGVYLLKVSNGQNMLTRRITIRN